jgi:hypothetical protein
MQKLGRQKPKGLRHPYKTIYAARATKREGNAFVKPPNSVHWKTYNCMDLVFR